MNVSSAAGLKLLKLTLIPSEHQSVIDYILVPNLFINRIISSFFARVDN